MNLRRKVARLLGPPLIAGILAVHVEGCAGTGVNSRSIAEPRRISPFRSARIGLGTEVEFTKFDGTVLRGRYAGAKRMSDDEYVRHWNEVAASHEPPLFAPGTLIEVAIAWNRQPRRGRFHGFSLEGLEMSDSTGAAFLVPFDRLTAVADSSGTKWTARALIDDALAGRLPASSLILLRVGTGVISVPADQIAVVGARDSHTGDLVAVGVIAGLAGAVLIIALIASSLDGGCDGGCDAGDIPSPTGM